MAFCDVPQPQPYFFFHDIILGLHSSPVSLLLQNVAFHSVSKSSTYGYTVVLTHLCYMY